MGIIYKIKQVTKYENYFYLINGFKIKVFYYFREIACFFTTVLKPTQVSKLSK